MRRGATLAARLAAFTPASTTRGTGPTRARLGSAGRRSWPRCRRCPEPPPSTLLGRALRRRRWSPTPRRGPSQAAAGPSPTRHELTRPPVATITAAALAPAASYQGRGKCRPAAPPPVVQAKGEGSPGCAAVAGRLRVAAGGSRTEPRLRAT